VDDNPAFPPPQVRKYKNLNKGEAEFEDSLNYGMSGAQGAANSMAAEASFPLNSPGIVGASSPGGGGAVGALRLGMGGNMPRLTTTPGIAPVPQRNPVAAKTPLSPTPMAKPAVQPNYNPVSRDTALRSLGAPQAAPAAPANPGVTPATPSPNAAPAAFAATSKATPDGVMTMTADHPDAQPFIDQILSAQTPEAARALLGDLLARRSMTGDERREQHMERREEQANKVHAYQSEFADEFDRMGAEEAASAPAAEPEVAADAAQLAEAQRVRKVRQRRLGQGYGA
jgi:hypothetical protein